MKRAPRLFLPPLAVAVLAAAVVAGAQAAIGTEKTGCAAYRLEEGSPDECETGGTGRIAKSGRVTFRVFCMESPGDRCTGIVRPRFIRYSPLDGRTRFISLRLQREYSVAAGPRGQKMRFKVSRRRARAIRRAQLRDLRLDVYTDQADGRLVCTSVDEVTLKGGTPAPAKGAPRYGAAQRRPDEPCLGRG